MKEKDKVGVRLTRKYNVLCYHETRGEPLCPSRALTLDEGREQGAVFWKWNRMKGLGAGKGIGSPYWAGLRPTKARPQNSTEKEKGAYIRDCAN